MFGDDVEQKVNKFERILRGLDGGATPIERFDDLQGQIRSLSATVASLGESQGGITQNITNTINQSMEAIESTDKVSPIYTHAKADEDFAKATPVYMDKDSKKAKRYTSNLPREWYMGLTTGSVPTSGDLVAQISGSYTFTDNKVPLSPLYINDSGDVVQENPTGNYLYIGQMQTEKTALLSPPVGYAPAEFPSVTAVTGYFNRVSTSSLKIDSTLLSSTTQGNAGCLKVGIPVITGYGFDNQCQMNSLFSSAGRATGGTISGSSATSITVSAGTGFIKATDSDTAELLSFGWDALTSVTVPTDNVRYFGVEYNSGSPQVVKKTANTWDLDTEFPLGSVINQSDDIYPLNNPWWVTDGITNIIERFQAEGYMTRDNYEGGMIIGVTGTRNPTLTAGKAWSRLTEYEISAKDCSGTDRIYTFYRKAGGGWNRSAELQQYPVDQYDDGSGALQNLQANRYANWWVFVEIDTANNGQLMFIYPQNQYTTRAQAEAETVPTFPTAWYEHGILVGRITIQEGDDTPIEIASTFDTIFSAALAADHSNLSNLNWASAGHTMDTTLDMASNPIDNVSYLNVSTTINASTVSTTNICVDNIYERTGAGNINIKNNMVIENGGTIGQAAGPLLTFDDTNNLLSLTGANLSFGTTTPVFDSGSLSQYLWLEGTETAGIVFHSTGVGGKQYALYNSRINNELTVINLTDSTGELRLSNMSLDISGNNITSVVNITATGNISVGADLLFPYAGYGTIQFDKFEDNLYIGVGTPWNMLLNDNGNTDFQSHNITSVGEGTFTTVSTANLDNDGSPIAVGDDVDITGTLQCDDSFIVAGTNNPGFTVTESGTSGSGQAIALCYFNGLNSNSDVYTYASWTAEATTWTDGDEKGKFKIKCSNAGALQDTITFSGTNVGIMNTGPTYNLDVTGTCRITTSILTPSIGNGGSAVAFTDGIQMSDGYLYEGRSMRFVSNNSSNVLFSGGNATNAGCNLACFGGAHPTLANLFRIRQNGTTVLTIPDGGNPDFQGNNLDNIGAIDVASIGNGGSAVAFTDFIAVAEDSGIGNSDSTERIIFDGTAGNIEMLGGYVGINETNPQSSLHITGDGAYGEVRLERITNNTANFTFRAGYGQWEIYDNNAAAIRLKVNSSGHTLPGADDTYDLGASGTEWRNLYIDGTANIDTAVIPSIGNGGSAVAYSDNIDLADNDILNVGNMEMNASGTIYGEDTWDIAYDSDGAGGANPYLRISSTKFDFNQCALGMDSDKIFYIGGGSEIEDEGGANLDIRQVTKITLAAPAIDCEGNIAIAANKSFDAYTNSGYVKIRRKNQSAQPSPVTGEIFWWRDTDDDKTYLLINDPDVGVRKVELT